MKKIPQYYSVIVQTSFCFSLFIEVVMIELIRIRENLQRHDFQL